MLMRQRVVGAEALDELPIDDPAAQRARRDLRRVHRFMASRWLLLRELHAAVPAPPAGRPLRLLELGAGDGTLLLEVARRLARHWPEVALTLLDRQDLLTPRTAADYAGLGWRVRQQCCDVLEWARQVQADPAAQRWDVIVTTLFLHHFADPALAALLRAVAASTRVFVALEPRRAPLALAASHLLALIGANAVTRSDAVLSVRAGFRDAEIGALWPATGWRTRERAAFAFSHGFVAVAAAPVLPA